MTEAQITKEIRYAEEGLEQMQTPGAGYYEDENNKQPHEIARHDRDIKGQCEGIDRLNRKLIRVREGK